MAVERAELELVWPAELFAAEAKALLAAGYDDRDSLGWLLAEAFYGDRGLKLFGEVAAADPGRFTADPWTADPWAEPCVGVSLGPRATQQLVADLAADAAGLPRWTPPQYYSARHNPQPQPGPVLAEVQAAYAQEVARFAEVGYFEDAFGSACVDAAEDPDGEGQRQLSELLDTDAALWPLAYRGEPTHLQEDWPEELFYDVVEALHDLVARPRRRVWHDYGREWDYSDFARRPGQAVYRWRVNQLLDRSGLGLHLAEGGSDRGRLVRTAGDARDQLVQQALRSPEPKVRDLVDHAVSQFRSRSASPLAKREATKTLADVLEHRRALLKQELFRGDEGALFHIANSFEIRHLNQRQKSDYDPAFLDWVFWWYLATVELTDRLLARQQLEHQQSAG